MYCLYASGTSDAIIIKPGNCVIICLTILWCISQICKPMCIYCTSFSKFLSCESLSLDEKEHEDSSILKNQRYMLSKCLTTVVESSLISLQLFSQVIVFISSLLYIFLSTFFPNALSNSGHFVSATD